LQEKGEKGKRRGLIDRRNRQWLKRGETVKIFIGTDSYKRRNFSRDGTCQLCRTERINSRREKGDVRYTQK